MQPFRLKPIASLTEGDFVESSVWACYYEPDDVDAIAGFGFDRSEVQKSLRATGYSDDYAFPLPGEAASAPFHYVYCSIRAETRGGSKLVGFITGACTAVYFRGKRYSFNSALREISLVTARELALALGEQAIFPIRYEVVATGEQKEADFW